MADKGSERDGSRWNDDLRGRCTDPHLMRCRRPLRGRGGDNALRAHELLAAMALRPREVGEDDDRVAVGF